MIKANELRIGNLLKYYIGEDGIEWQETKIDAQDIIWADCKNANFNKVHKAVELTSEILYFYGFKRSQIFEHDYSIYVGEWGVFVISEDSEGLYYSLNNKSFSKRLQNVHELQNLFFALTGTELKEFVLK